jgi:hypothetical protein
MACLLNGTENGIGHLRSQQTGKAISGSAGNRVPTGGRSMASRPHGDARAPAGRRRRLLVTWRR